MGTLAKLLLGIFIGICIIWVVVPHSSQSSDGENNVTKALQEARLDKQKAIATAIDYRDTTTINFARELVKNTSAGSYNAAQVCDIWEYSYRNWHYVNDPRGGDYYSSASNSITNGLKGDCDDFAILVAGSVEAIGGTSRVVTATDGKGGGHAYAEVYIGDSQEDVQSVTDYICSRYSCTTVWTHHETDDEEVTRYWLNLDWQANHPGGPYTAENTIKFYYPQDSSAFVPLPVPTISPAIKKILQMDPIQPKSTQKAVLRSSKSVYDIPLTSISYGHMRSYSLSGAAGNTYKISIRMGAPVDVLVMDTTNYNKYSTAFSSGSSSQFKTQKTFTSVTSADFTFVLPAQGQPYYLVIENGKFLTNGADAKKTVYGSVDVTLTS